MESTRQKIHHRLLDLHPRLPSRNASFSSSLLDAIDRSIVNGGVVPDQRPSSRHVTPAYSLRQDRRSLNLYRLPERRPFSVLSSSSSSESSYGGLSSSRPQTKLPLQKKQDPTPKTPKSPLSPGARIAGFLNSLFSPKTKSPSINEEKPAPRRTVRFTDEDKIYFPRLTAIRVREETAKHKGSVSEERKRYEIARKLVSSYEERNKVFSLAVLNDEEDDDAASYCSNDLFELKDLAAIGGATEELPVYETTNFSRWCHRVK